MSDPSKDLSLSLTPEQVADLFATFESAERGRDDFEHLAGLKGDDYTPEDIAKARAAHKRQVAVEHLIRLATGKRQEIVSTDPNMPLIAAVLNDAQQQALAFCQAYNVPASYFVGVPNVDGSVEVIAIGAESPAESFIWSFRISAEGETSTSEATVGEFNSGIEI
jgi:hypothetical protein